MAKQFKNMKSACTWLKSVVDACANETRGNIAEQVYKDSNEFTYRDTGEMYKSGSLQREFKDGYVVERTPYVRRRYYEGGKAGTGNPKAEPRWFEKTWAKNSDDYQDMCISVFKRKKSGKK